MRALRIEIILFATVVCLAQQGADANITARINRVGLFAGGAQAARDGVMTFAEVELRNTGAAPFDGTLKLSQIDRDGDVVVSEVPVAVAPDGVWEKKEIYFVPNGRTTGDHVTVRIYDANGDLVEFQTDVGETVRALESDAFYDEPAADDLLIVHMSSGNRSMHAAQLDFSNQASSISTYITSRKVRGIAPREIPRKSQGLFAVDALIWEDADPGELQPEQIEAVAGWVRQGGRLLITVAAHWQEFDDSPLGDLLPLQFTGVEDVSKVPGFEDIVRNDFEMAELNKRYEENPIPRCRIAPRAGAIPIPSSDGVEAPIAYRAHVGCGMVTVVGARLNDLLPPPRIPEYDDSEAAKEKRERFAALVEKAVGDNLLALPGPREAVQGQMYYITEPRNLFEALTRSIGFGALTIAFLFFAIAFAAVYTFSATLGSYFVLKRRNRERHCWTAFTAVGVVGLFIGLGMVWVLRGFSTKVSQTNVIDGRANHNYAYATCLFGVKTKDHTRLDLRLPVGYSDSLTSDGVIYPLPQPSRIDLGETAFVASDSYHSVLAGTALLGVPVRATLKEFEGHWHGDIGGTLDAKLVYDEKTKRFTEDSFIRNNLGFALEDCYLIEGDQDIAGEANLVAGVRCHPLKNIGAKAPESDLGGEALFDRIYQPKTQPDGTEKLRTGTELRLQEFAKNWAPDSSMNWMPGQSRSKVNVTVDAIHAPFLLLSVYNLLDSNQSSWTLKRSFGRGLDCSHWITKETALLIGFSSETAAPVLEIDGSMEKPVQSLSVYRFLIPVERRK